MRYLVIDLETTGLDPHDNSVIELGYALYDAKQPTPITGSRLGNYIAQDKPVSNEIVKITGITNAILGEFGRPGELVFEEFLDFVHEHQVEVFAGHNALSFDKPFLANDLKRYNLQLPNLPWIDTKIDLPLDYNPKSTALVYMAADHHFLNPFSHRALFDALTCGVLINKYPLQQILDIIDSPIIEIRAVVSYDNRSKASSKGFRWDGERKLWVKSIRACFLEKERAQADFNITIL